MFLLCLEESKAMGRRERACVVWFVVINVLCVPQARISRHVCVRVCWFNRANIRAEQYGSDTPTTTTRNNAHIIIEMEICQKREQAIGVIITVRFHHDHFSHLFLFIIPVECVTCARL